MQITGTITKIGEVQSFGNNGFTKRDVIIKTEEKYPNDFCIELHKDNTSLADNLAEGQEVTFDVNLRGKEWINPKGEAKYFATLVGWRLANGNSEPSSEPNTIIDENTPLGSVDESDLPF